MLLNVVIKVMCPMLYEEQWDMEHQDQVHFMSVLFFPTYAWPGLEEDTSLVKRVEYGRKDQPAKMIVM